MCVTLFKTIVAAIPKKLVWYVLRESNLMFHKMKKRRFIEESFLLATLISKVPTELFGKCDEKQRSYIWNWWEGGRANLLEVSVQLFLDKMGSYSEQHCTGCIPCVFSSDRFISKISEVAYWQQSDGGCISACDYGEIWAEWSISSRWKQLICELYYWCRGKGWLKDL